MIRAIDVGGSGIFRRADIEGAELRNLVRSAKPITDLVGLFDFAKQDLSPETTGIAYAIAGIVEGNNFLVKVANAHFLDNTNLAQRTEEVIGIKSAVFNDMEAAVTGMAALMPDEPYFLGITWSSGIGVRYWRYGRLVCPDEAGHMVIDPSPFAPLCGCGKKGHAEAIIGGHAVRRRVINETEALAIPIPEGKHPCQFLNEEFNRHKIWATKLYEIIFKGMGILLANLRCCYEFPLVVWKGTFAENAFKRPMAEELIRDAMQEVLINPAWANKNNLRFRMTPAPEDKDALIGAASAFLKSQKPMVFLYP